VLAPLYSIFIYKQTYSEKKALIYIAGVMGLLALITLIPMALFNWPLSNLYCALAAHMSSTNVLYNGEASSIYGAASPFNLYNVFKALDPAITPPWTLNYLWIIALSVLYYHAIHHISDVDFTSIVNWSFLASLIFFTTRFWVSEQNLMLLFAYFVLVVLFNRTRTSWKYIHTLWFLLFIFVLIHVPVVAFDWIADPHMLDVAIAISDSPLVPFRWVVMSGLTFSWLTILWHYAIKRMVWR
jgi:hypothetical protein